MVKNNLVYLRHIIEAIELINEFVLHNTLISFVGDEKSISAVAYQVQVIGEAAGHVEDQFRSKYPDVPWQDAIDTRHKIVHHYMEIDPEILWDIVQKDLPDLEKKIHTILEKEL